MSTFFSNVNYFKTKSRIHETKYLVVKTETFEGNVVSYTYAQSGGVFNGSA